MKKMKKMKKCINDSNSYLKLTSKPKSQIINELIYKLAL